MIQQQFQDFDATVIGRNFTFKQAESNCETSRYLCVILWDASEIMFRGYVSSKCKHVQTSYKQAWLSFVDVADDLSRLGHRSEAVEETVGKSRHTILHAVLLTKEKLPAGVQAMMSRVLTIN